MIIMHDATKRRLEQLLQSPPHGLALIAPTGMGKTAVALWLVAQILDIEKAQVARYPYLLQVVSSGDSISIDSIRELQQFTTLKTIGNKQLRRFIIIENAERLTLEAQNALLKTLEEPPIDTLIILTLNNAHVLRPTVMSRLQSINLQIPSRQTLDDFFSPQGYSNSEITNAYNISGGLPGHMESIFNNNDDLLMEAINYAKRVLVALPFERLLLVDEISKQKLDPKLVLQALLRIADISLGQTAKKQDTKALIRWKHVLKGVQQAQVALQHNAQNKLVFSNLMLQL